jgi:phosphatidylglycerophosphate synthase
MMPTVRIGPIFGVIGQLVLLALLAATIDLGVAGWATGVAVGVFTGAVLTRSMNGAGVDALGPADRVTLIRATLVGCVAALTADSFHRPASVRMLLTIAAVALVLDALDGHVARRTGTASALGARFDMEVDAFLILVLSIYVSRSMGTWVLMIGTMRYAFVVATWAVRWLGGPLPSRFWRKVVAAIQGIVLAAAASDLFPAPLTLVALAGALALLVESFGRDIVWRWNHRALSHLDPARYGRDAPLAPTAGRITV